MTADEAIRKIVDALVHQAVARCDRLGIDRYDFYLALKQEQQLHPVCTTSELFEYAFQQLAERTN